MKVCLLASGSKGNALYVEAGACRILVDAGLSARELQHRLTCIGVAATDLNAIFITHEHTDHVKGAGTLARRLGISIVTSHSTHREAHELFKKCKVLEFEAGVPFRFNDILIDPFAITHDACDPVGFRIECVDGNIGIATDLGIATRLVQEKLKGCGILVLESNHDEELLNNGPYPWHLKQRIRSRHGHLSNAESVALLEQLLHGDLLAVFLAHLSEVNNDPLLVLQKANELIQKQSLCAPQLIIGSQYAATPVYST